MICRACACDEELGSCAADEDGPTPKKKKKLVMISYRVKVALADEPGSRADNDKLTADLDLGSAWARVESSESFVLGCNGCADDGGITNFESGGGGR
jgi:hypothetical protein